MVDPRPGVVLFVDDDAELCDVAEMVLSTTGFRCRAVRTAYEALAAAAEIRFDIVVLDVTLRRASDGLALARRLLRSDHPPLIAVQTARSREELPQDVAVAAYLRKPYQPSALVELVAQLLKGRGAPRS